MVVVLTAVHCQGSTDNWGRAVGLACYRKVSKEGFNEMLDKNIHVPLLDRCKWADLTGGGAPSDLEEEE